MRSHEEFLELCALSTSGELSEQEREKLDEHLVGCGECREAFRQFEAVVDVGVPTLIPQVSAARETRSAHRNGHRHASTNWSLAWLSLGVTVLLIVALGIFALRTGRTRDVATSAAAAASSDARVDALERELSDAGHQREVLQGQVTGRNRTVSTLQHEIRVQSTALAELKVSQAKLEQSLQVDDDANREAKEQSAELAQQLVRAQLTLDKTEGELESIRQQQGEAQERAAALNEQIETLSNQLREQNAAIDKQDELLAHDHDIRELMGARNLYIAEIYDVGRNGETQKPFGRIFYTKEKSLVFYAYDLEAQQGIKDASAFQAWGRRGQQSALNLGIFYQDSAAKKRWVLKFDNPKELAEVDAVFVTVEPKGGSARPTGKPLLFASLRVGANHP